MILQVVEEIKFTAIKVVLLRCNIMTHFYTLHSHSHVVFKGEVGSRREDDLTERCEVECPSVYPCSVVSEKSHCTIHIHPRCHHLLEHTHMHTHHTHTHKSSITLHTCSLPLTHTHTHTQHTHTHTHNHSEDAESK